MGGDCWWKSQVEGRRRLVSQLKRAERIFCFSTFLLLSGPPWTGRGPPMLERDPFHSSLISSGNAVTDTPCNDGRQHLGSCDRTHSKMRYRSVSGGPPLLLAPCCSVFPDGGWGSISHRAACGPGSREDTEGLVLYGGCDPWVCTP